MRLSDVPPGDLPGYLSAGRAGAFDNITISYERSFLGEMPTLPYPGPDRSILLPWADTNIIRLC